MRRSLTAAGACAAVLALLAVIAASALAGQVRVAGQVYRCAPATADQRVVPPAPPAPPASTSVGPLARSRLLAQAVCPVGELPAPRVIAAPPPRPPRLDLRRATGQATGAEEQLGADYFYAVEGAARAASAQVTGLQGEAEDQQETIDPAGDGHSITQMWGLDTTRGAAEFSDVELGTIVSPDLGEGAPTLFVFHFDEGEPTCYDACGYVQLSDVAGRVPGYPLVEAAPLMTAGAPHLYQLYEEGLTGKWFLAVDGEPIGYYPASAWTRFVPTVLTVEEAGGEVASPPTEPHPGTTMGDGRPGSEGASAAAPEAGPTYWRALADRRVGEQTFTPLGVAQLDDEPGVYTLGAYKGEAPEVPLSSFAYGGPGWVVPAVSLSAATAITPTTATLAGAVDPRGEPSSYWFEYTLNPNGAWASTPPAEAGQGRTPIAASATLTGLDPQSTYWYRLVAADANATERTPLASFLTAALPAAVVVPTVPAGGVSSFTAQQPPAPLRARLLKVSERGGVVTVRLSVSRRSLVRITGHGLVRFAGTLGPGTHVLRVRLTALGRAAARGHRRLSLRISITAGATSISKLAHLAT